MLIERLATWVIIIWTATGMAFGAFALLNIPILAISLAHAVRRLRDPEFHLRATLPTHALLQFFCAVVYGILYPGFYFLAVRTRSELSNWYLGSGVNSRWTIAIGAACMAWLAVRLAEAAFSGRRLIFAASWTNRVVSLLGVGLCLWFHFKTIDGLAITYESSQSGLSPNSWFRAIVYPQSCFAITASVFALAFLESLRKPINPIVNRHPILAGTSGLAFVGLLFMPYWLSIPRVTHEQALTLIEKNRVDLIETARGANLDPKLLAGIIYVAQTRDHPRWTGDLRERFAVALWRRQNSPSSIGFGGAALLNPSIGLCQIQAPTFHRLVWRMTDWRVTTSGQTPNGGFVESWFDPEMQSSTRLFQYDPGPNLRIDARLQNLLEKHVFGRELGSSILDDRSSLIVAASLLVVYRFQWEQAGFPIADRPEILATLYNIGFARSHPHADPKSNDFGHRVLAFMKSEAARNLFPDPKEAPHEP